MVFLISFDPEKGAVFNCFKTKLLQYSIDTFGNKDDFICRSEKKKRLMAARRTAVDKTDKHTAADALLLPCPPTH